MRPDGSVPELPSIFLSYARQDDDEFVHRLYTTLRDLGFQVWWDKTSMPSRSLTFTEEIRDAIHRSDRVVVVLGPKAIRSQYVRAEWQSALAERKPVVPVVRRVPEEIPDLYAWLPAELRQLHAPDLQSADGVEPSLEPLIRVLTEPVPPPAPVFGGSPELPAHFRPRPDVFARLSEIVLRELTGPVVHTGHDRVAVLIGMGGIGKTALAAAFVETVRSQPSLFFSDGIYWLTGSPLRRLATLCSAVPTDPLSESSIADAVAAQLDGKRFLLVVDNATSVEDIAPLARVLGPNGRMLVTTRNGELAAGHQRVDVSDLTEDDALALVADWLSVPVAVVPPEARRMIELCGRHPFAIAVNAAAVRQGLSWLAILTALARHDLDFAEQRFEEYVYATVDESLRVSVQALPDDERDRYQELAAFIWDPSVPGTAIARFWSRRGGLAGHRAERLLVRLRQRSLLQLHGAPDAYEVRLHDLQRAHLKSDEENTTQLAEALLESYRPDPPDAWWTVVDDGYLRDHLVRHLATRGPVTELTALLCAEDDQQRNRWWDARGGRSIQSFGENDGFAGYVADINVAMQHVPGPLLPLITASLRSVADAVPGKLLGESVRRGQWSLERATAAALLVPEPDKRAAAMLELLGRAPDRASWLDDTLAAIGSADVSSRQPLVNAVAKMLDPAEVMTVLTRIVGWVRDASTPFERTQLVPLIRPVLDRLPAASAPEAVALVTSVGVTPLSLFGLLPEPERSARIGAAIDAARATSGDLGVTVLATTVAEVARHLEPSAADALVDEAVAALRRLPAERSIFRREGLLALLPVLPAGERKNVLGELMHDAVEQPGLWARLAASTPPEQQGAVRTALEGQDWVRIAEAAPAFAGEERRVLVDRVLTEIEARTNAASLLWMDDAELLLAMDEQQVQRAKRIIDAQLTGDPWIRAHIGVVRATSPQRREAEVDEVLAAIDALSDAQDRKRAYTAIAPYLDDRQLVGALRSAVRIGEPSGWEHLPTLLPYVSIPTRVRVLGAFSLWASSRPFWEWEPGVRALPAGLTSPEAAVLMELARTQSDETETAHLLALLVSKVDETARDELQAYAEAAIDRCPPSRRRFGLLLAMGAADRAEQELQNIRPSLSVDELAQAVAELAALSPERTSAWVGLVLSADGDGDYVLERIAALLDVTQARTCLARLVRPEKSLDWGLLIEAMDTTLPGVSARDEPPAIGALARRLGQLGSAGEAWSLLGVGRDDEITATGMVELAPYLSADRVRLVDERVRRAHIGKLVVPQRTGRISNVDRSYLTGRLAPALARAGDVDRALGYARSTDAERWQVPALLGIAEAVDADTRTAVLIEAFAVVAGLREVFRRDHLDDVANAVAADPAAAAEVWPRALEWSRQRPRHEAIEMLTRLAPVAAAAVGSELVDEVFEAVSRVTRWWP